MGIIKKRMKRMLLGITLLGLFGGAACKKKDSYVGVPVQEVCTVYEAQNASSYTIDNDGNLYYLEQIFETNGDRTVTLVKKDVNGNLIFSREMDTEIFYGSFGMTEKNGVLYFSTDGFDKNGEGTFLYSYHPDTEEITLLQIFRYFKRVERIVVTENRIYLLGRNRYSGGASTTLGYHYSGEKIMWCSINGGEVYELGFAEPIDMNLAEDGTPLFYLHEKDGFSIVSLDEKTENAKVLVKSEDHFTSCFALCNEEKSLLYCTMRGLVLSDLSDLSVETELYPDTVVFDNGLRYVNGRVVCRTHQGEIVQFPLDKVKKETETLRFLSVGYESDTPYGCGYRIERTNFREEELDKFALKILARDKDFDLCMVNTYYSKGDNLKENSNFYPLNDIPGIQEYLNACFPYVKEAATREDGTIWMLPIDVDIAGLVMNAELTEAYGFKNNMTYDDFFRVLSLFSSADEVQKFDIPMIAYIRNFFGQYFLKYESVDTSVFRGIMSEFSSLWSMLTRNEMGSESEKIYQYVGAAEYYHYAYLDEFCENKVVYSFPKLAAEDRNTGTCLYLAINSQSEQLTVAKQYICDLIAYTMKQQEKPLFFADREVENDLYEQSLYELYQNGEIVYNLNVEIYDGYEDVLKDLSDLESYIRETDRKLKMYLKE